MKLRTQLKIAGTLQKHAITRGIQKLEAIGYPFLPQAIGIEVEKDGIKVICSTDEFDGVFLSIAELDMGEDNWTKALVEVKIAADAIADAEASLEADTVLEATEVA